MRAPDRDVAQLLYDGHGNLRGAVHEGCFTTFTYDGANRLVDRVNTRMAQTPLRDGALDRHRAHRAAQRAQTALYGQLPYNIAP